MSEKIDDESDGPSNRHYRQPELSDTPEEAWLRLERGEYVDCGDDLISLTLHNEPVRAPEIMLDKMFDIMEDPSLKLNERWCAGLGLEYILMNNRNVSYDGERAIQRLEAAKLLEGNGFYEDAEEALLRELCPALYQEQAWHALQAGDTSLLKRFSQMKKLYPLGPDELLRELISAIGSLSTSDDDRAYAFDAATSCFHVDPPAAYSEAFAALAEQATKCNDFDVAYRAENAFFSMLLAHEPRRAEAFLWDALTPTQKTLNAERHLLLVLEKEQALIHSVTDHTLRALDVVESQDYDDDDREGHLLAVLVAQRLDEALSDYPGFTDRVEGAFRALGLDADHFEDDIAEFFEKA